MSEEQAEPTDEERRLFRRLDRLAEDWPKHLTLASMDGMLVVARTEELRPETPGDGLNGDAVLWSTLEIPNDGGGW